MVHLPQSSILVSTLFEIISTGTVNVYHGKLKIGGGRRMNDTLDAARMECVYAAMLCFRLYGDVMLDGELHCCNYA